MGEVRKVVFSMGPLKASGLDGYQLMFFNFKDIGMKIGMDVLNFMIEILRNCVVL